MVSIIVAIPEERAMTESDSEIVGLIKTGQLERYSDLVKRYERYVFSIVSRFVSALHVSDVAQEAPERLQRFGAIAGWRSF